MIINPQTLIDQGFITGIKDSKQIQPNGLDFTIDNVSSVDRDHFIIRADNSKKMRDRTQLDLVCRAPNEVLTWKIRPEYYYDGMSDVYVSLPEDVACKLLIRSSLARNGIMINCGLFDSGFEGHIGFTFCSLINGDVNVDTYIEPGTRFGQAVFFKAESAYEYNGEYKHARGTHWTDIKDMGE